MKSTRTRRGSIGWILLVALVLVCGCAGNPQATVPTPTVDVQATVDAAVGATATAEAENEAMVATAIAGTRAAEPVAVPTATPPSVAAPTSEATEPPTPTTEPVSTETYVTMTEEELAALIDQAVADAVAATEAATAQTTAATADQTLTQEEVDQIEVVISGADEAIALAEEVLYAYADLYADLATETLVMVDEMEALLQETTEMVVVMTDVLSDVDQALETGAEITAQMLQDLEQAAQTADDRAAALQAQIGDWPDALQAELTRRVTEALAVPPAEVAQSRVEAILGAYDYIDVTRSALSDQRISQEEMTNIAQMGANAVSGLQSQGGPQLQGLADKLNQITVGVAKGQLPQIQPQLQSLESSLPARPARP